ncbi:alkaline phosphatase family protein [Brevibacillus porteri]|uniref:Nucleotide pyrophosphatase n=1 Tax=Brevibacillus porteri TaxID=2126350 RepID=A0ABX5FJ10_9BACL|nr:alkaline phosphatase family protein [Brevibacillus porteri]MED1802006.1 alkaline phosphatase family protein [Brevibacillus porteri]MED2132567.1 alkaline phosphatase family protein [Brevibacillus porteri]MED2745447.1 alkaline phosphatase family protein [Brevibacillus porteri]MED2814276.1 alkaline phosphatase family protein [Brevibacillus porteri]MED2892525.1 alkaline phosphatase family protein [Brevibacillus porteri]
MCASKLAMIVLDGLRFDTAISHMGYLHHLVEYGIAARFQVRSELPSLSRPLYEVLLTGTPVWKNGISSNQVVRLSHQESLFHLTQKNGMSNAAAAYCWVSELYNKAPFNPFHDRIQLNTDKPIQNGMFYWEDHYPDTHLFADANFLLNGYNPDFLYVHSMNIDDDGHKHTADSARYRNRVLAADSILANVLPAWIDAGYQIIVTADHGMTADGNHGGTSSADRDVPLFVISNLISPGIREEAIPQLQVAPLACHLLGISPSKEMQPLNV